VVIHLHRSQPAQICHEVRVFGVTVNGFILCLTCSDNRSFRRLSLARARCSSTCPCRLWRLGKLAGWFRRCCSHIMRPQTVRYLLTLSLRTGKKVRSSDIWSTVQTLHNYIDAQYTRDSFHDVIALPLPSTPTPHTVDFDEYHPQYLEQIWLMMPKWRRGMTR